MATKNRAPLHDYSDRSGFPLAPDAMRGAAADFEAPPDMRIPVALRPWKPIELPRPARQFEDIVTGD